MSDTNKRKGRNINGRLMRQIIPIVYGVILFTTLLCSIIMNLYSEDIMLNSQRNDSITTMELLANSLNDTGDLEWFINYWTEHYEEMDIYGSGETVMLINKKFSELTVAFQEEYGISITDFLGEFSANMDYRSIYSKFTNTMRPENQSPRLQKLIAEYAYLMIADRFNIMKNGDKYTYLTCVVPLEDDKAMSLFSGKSYAGWGNDDKDYEAFQLGTVFSIPRDKYPHYYTTLETGEVAEGQGISISDSTRENNFHFYYPVMNDEGKVICMLCSSGKIAEIQDLLTGPYQYVEILNAVILFLATLLIAVIFNKKTVVPIKSIQNSIKEYSETKDNGKLKQSLDKINPNNEIGLLSDELSQMGDELTEHIEDVKRLSVKEERLNTELELATRIQETALATDFDCLPDNWHIKVYGSMAPAKEVGGDLYDFYQIDDDHLALVIGDVSGKGVPASLLMMKSLVNFRNECRYSSDPGTAMRKVNENFCDREQVDMFVTAWIGILEVSTGILKMANAGHENPIIKRADGSIEELKEKHDLVLGIMNNVNYRTTEVQLNRGDTLVVYTDGVPEAINENKEQYGIDRFKKCLEMCKENSGPEDYILAVKEDMGRFVGDAEQFDDTTMLIMTY